MGVFIPGWLIVLAIVAYFFFRKKEQPVQAPRSEDQKQAKLAMAIAKSELKRVTGGDGDMTIQMSDSEICRLARDATSHLNTDQAAAELLVRGAMRIVRLQWIREWLGIWSKEGGLVPDDIRTASDEQLLMMDPERLMDVKRSAMRVLLK